MRLKRAVALVRHTYCLCRHSLVPPPAPPAVPPTCQHPPAACTDIARLCCTARRPCLATRCWLGLCDESRAAAVEQALSTTAVAIPLLLMI